MTVADGVPRGEVVRVHDELGGQQDLSRHRARRGHVRHARSRQPGEARSSPRAARRRTRGAWRCTCRSSTWPGTEAPFIVGADGPDRLLFTALDNLIAQKRVPAMVAISIGNGSGDAQGSQRGLEYDTMSGQYAEFVETEVLPLVEAEVQREADQGPRRPGDDGLQLRRRLRDDHGLVPARPVSPRAQLLRHVREPAVAAQPRDARRRLGVSQRASSRTARRSRCASGCTWATATCSTPTSCATTCTTGSMANERMAKVLAEKGYHYQFVFARNCGHCDGAVKQQTLPAALEYVVAGVSEVARACRDRVSTDGIFSPLPDRNLDAGF